MLAQNDRVNEGASPSEAIEYIRELNPDLSFIQAKCRFNRTLVLGHPDKSKKHEAKAQATATRRSAITVEQQFRWHTTYDGALNDLRRLNTGLCRLTGKTFGELIRYFITGGDETCFMACELGSVTVIGSDGRKKH